MPNPALRAAGVCTPLARRSTPRPGTGRDRLERAPEHGDPRGRRPLAPPLRAENERRAPSPAPVPASIREAWRRYKASGSVVARNVLVSHYMTTHVRPIAVRVHAGLPNQVDVEDLVQQAYLGLIDSMDRFDTEREIRFETFSRRRIFGAIQDYLRSIDPVPRLDRARFKQVQAVRERFRKMHGRPPAEEELAPLVELGPTPVDRYVRDSAPAATVSFSCAQPETGEDDDRDGDAMASFIDHRNADPLPAAARRDLQHWLTRGFDDRDRLIIVLYYYEKLTMSEVGAALGISESRVSQRLDAIVKCLQSRLAQENAQEFVFGV